MSTSSDIDIWNYSKANNYAVLTKDKDFNHLLAVYGFPPTIILMDIGNSSTDVIISILNKHKDAAQMFLEDDNKGLLTIIT